jgi:ABC-type dipeptide/oligopeptide/nickel transport system permease component
MLRQSLIYLLLSILVVVFAKYAHLLIVYIDMFFTHVNLRLTPIFSQTGWGLVIRKILVLMILPIILVGIPALVYKALKHRDMPHFIAITWVVWTIIVLSDILIR